MSDVLFLALLALSAGALVLFIRACARF